MAAPAVDALLRSEPAGEVKSSAVGDGIVSGIVSCASFSSAPACCADTASDGLGLLRRTGVAGGLLIEFGLRKLPRALVESLTTLDADCGDLRICRAAAFCRQRGAD